LLTGSLYLLPKGENTKTLLLYIHDNLQQLYEIGLLIKVNKVKKDKKELEKLKKKGITKLPILSVDDKIYTGVRAILQLLSNSINSKREASTGDPILDYQNELANGLTGTMMTDEDMAGEDESLNTQDVQARVQREMEARKLLNKNMKQNLANENDDEPKPQTGKISLIEDDDEPKQQAQQVQQQEEKTIQDDMGINTKQGMPADIDTRMQIAWIGNNAGGGF
jgi:hypothetical protein